MKKQKNISKQQLQHLEQQLRFQSKREIKEYLLLIVLALVGILGIITIINERSSDLPHTPIQIASEK